MPDVQKPSRLAVLTTVHRWGDPRVFERNASAALEWGLEVHAFVPGCNVPDLPDWANTSRFHLHWLPLPANRLARLRLSLFAWRYLVRDGAFDVVHFHDPELIPAMIFLRLLNPRTRILYDVHEELPLEVLSKSYIPKVFRVAVAALARNLWWLAAKCFHGFAPATEAIAKHWPTERTRVVHNYPKQLFRSQLVVSRLDSLRVVFTGGLSEIRGIRELLLALQAVRCDYPKLRLELYGPLVSTSLGPLIQRAVSDGWCQHVSWLPQSELAARMQGCGVGAVPYHPIPDHMEALPTKLFEYMALGIPMLISDFPLWKEILAHASSGLAVPPTVGGLEEGLRFMISHPEKLRQWSENGRREYESCYRWEVESNNLKWLYDKMGLEVTPREISDPDAVFSA